jgi:hypothetical protein
LSRGDAVAKSIGGGDTASDGIDGSLPSGAISEIVKASAEDTELSTRVVVKTVAREKDFSRAFDKLCFSPRN